LRCGSAYFRGLHVEETFDLPLGPTGWPRAHHSTVPDGVLPQSGCIAQNGIAATDCTEYTTVAGVYTGGGDPAALGRAMGALASLAEANGCAAMVAFARPTLQALGAPPPPELLAFTPKFAGDSGNELLPTGEAELLLFVKGREPAAASAVTACFLETAGLAGAAGLQTTVGFGNSGRDLTGFIGPPRGGQDGLFASGG
jgi:hypothetical protein